MEKQSEAHEHELLVLGVYTGCQRLFEKQGDPREPAGFVLLHVVNAASLQRDDTIILREVVDFLDDELAVLGGKGCPPCYRITAARTTDDEVIVETVLAWFSSWGEQRRTFHLDRSQEVAIMSAKAYRSLRADWGELN